MGEGFISIYMVYSFPVIKNMDFIVGSKDIYVGEILETNVESKVFGEGKIIKIGLKDGSVLCESHENVQLLEVWCEKEKASKKSVGQSNFYFFFNTK